MTDLALASKIKESLKDFFGKDMQVSPLPQEITDEKLQQWGKFKLSLHFLPYERFKRENNYPGWKNIIQEDWFYQAIKKGKFSEECLVLPGRWILIDNRSKPAFDDSHQVYEDDEHFLGLILKKLREEKKIDLPESGGIPVPLGSRFGVSPEEFYKFVRPELAKLLNFKTEQIRLPRAIEWSYLGNHYYSQWGQTNTWEWFDDRITGGTASLFGGCIDDFGLSGLYYWASVNRFSSVGMRPLVLL